MAEGSSPSPPLGDAEAPAVLVWVPGMEHQQAPLHAHQGWQWGMERLRRLASEILPSRPVTGAVEGLQTGSLGSLIEACRRFQTSSSAAAAPSFPMHFGVALAASSGGAAPTDVQRATCIARHAPIGTIGLQAEVVDAAERTWEMPLVDLGEVHCRACGPDEPATKVLALTAGWGTTAPDPLALRNALVVLVPQLASDNPGQADAAAELLADTMATVLARSALLRVVARESSRRLTQAHRAVADAFEVLHAGHVLCGQGRLSTTGDLQLDLSLMAAGQASPVWTHRLSLHLDDLLSGRLHPLMQALADLHFEIASATLRDAQLPSWTHLEDHQLLMAASQLMHRLSPAAFKRSKQLLDTLVQRRPEQALGHAWQAKWQVMAVVQGLTPRRAAMVEVHAACRRALALDPHCALALALQGYAHIMEGHPVAASRQAFMAALDANPNEAFAWLFSALAATFEDRLDAALEAVQVAQALSPLDPWRYLFDAIAAHVHLARGDTDTALLYAESSARLRALHGPNLFYLVVAHARRGDLHLAQTYLQQLLELWPAYTLRTFWSTYAGRDTPHAKDFAWALTAAGLSGS